MKSYERLNKQDLKIIQVAVQKLPIVGSEASLIAGLLKKIQMEIDLVDIPQEERPQDGDLITKD